jgi:cobalt-zinc-cadmium efflux system outer membrane protein
VLDDMHALRALALLAPLLWSCAGPGLTTRYHEQENAWRSAAPVRGASDDPFAGQTTLDRRALIAAVLARNPNIEAARWAWRAALARYPQQTALEDPMLAYALAPASIGSSQVDTGQRVTLSQALPFPGKRGLRGEVALAEAEAAANDFAAVRLRLAALASLLFDEAYLIERKLAVNDAHRALLAELRAIAIARYEAGVAAQQDPLEAELVEAELLHRDVALRADREITREQLNVLLHRSPELPLPASPAMLEPRAPAGEPRDALLARALAERPELRAAEARIAAREAAVALARREYLPDLRLMGGYDTFEEESDMRPMVGLELNLPLRRARRAAALDEAEAALEEARSARAGLDDQVRFSVGRALARLAEAHHALEIFRDRMLPAARDRVASARASFETGQSDFSTVIDAERRLRDAELGHEEAAVEVSRRHAELDRALGALPEGGLR